MNRDTATGIINALRSGTVPACGLEELAVGIDCVHVERPVHGHEGIDEEAAAFRAIGTMIVAKPSFQSGGH
ncbi:MAG: BREX system ATP-binding domain-containing protein [Candidatus Xenobia bacterium]